MTLARSPSRTGVVSHDGWHAWRVPRLGGTKLNELRMQYVASSQQPG